MVNFENSVKPLVKEKLPDAVYNQVCRLLLEGGIAPGQTVKIAALADAFQVSHMPIREAISRLTAKGALTIISGRSVGVPKMTMDRLIELRNVRCEVEAVAVRWAVKNASDQDISDLSPMMQALIDAEKNGDTLAYLVANLNFHFAVYSLAHSPLMMDIIENLWLQVSPTFHHLKESGNFEISNRLHQDLLDALARRDESAAVTALTQDIDRAFETMKSEIEKEIS